jgi:hypothetical protein
VRENNHLPPSTSEVKNGGFEVLSGGYEEFYLLGLNAVWFVEIKLMFWRNMSPLSSGSKNKPNNKSA